jgi:hypothetical protein
MNEVRIFAAAAGAYLAVVTLASWRWQRDFFRVSRLIERPGALYGIVPLPVLGEQAFLVCGALIVAGCATGALGYRFGFAAAYIGAVGYFSQIRLLDTIQRKVNLIPPMLLLLAAAPATAAPWNADADRWVLAGMQTLIALTFVGAGLAKLRRAGIGWAEGSSLQAFLLEADLRYDVPRARRLASSHALCRGLSIAVLLFELVGWTLLFLPAGAYVFAALAIAFHTGTWLFMRVNFLKYQAAAYLVFAASPLAQLLVRFAG